MARADYAHSIWTHNGQPFIVIEDLNKGKCSVTNDIENVIEEIATKEKINPVEYWIVYRDSREIWDGYNFSQKVIIPLVEKNWMAAMDKYIALASN